MEDFLADREKFSDRGVAFFGNLFYHLLRLLAHRQAKAVEDMPDATIPFPL